MTLSLFGTQPLPEPVMTWVLFEFKYFIESWGSIFFYTTLADRTLSLMQFTNIFLMSLYNAYNVDSLTQIWQATGLDA